MAFPSRVVFDTNILVSALLSTDSRPRQVFRLATNGGVLLASDVTLAEVEAVLLRDKFAKWLSIEVRKEFLASYRETVQLIPIVSRLQVCRDPGDDKFLELAVDGNADLTLPATETCWPSTLFRAFVSSRRRNSPRFPHFHGEKCAG
jgi:putative PIN family toxin of toxin-antitoxin system